MEFLHDGSAPDLKVPLQVDGAVVILDLLRQHVGGVNGREQLVALQRLADPGRMGVAARRPGLVAVVATGVVDQGDVGNLALSLKLLNPKSA